MPGVRDFDRPLDDSGKGDAEDTGVIMNRNAYVPELTLCSGALRARQTLEGVASQADTGRIHFDDTLYMTDAAGYLELIRGHGASETILVIGHNPMIEDLALAISGNGDDLAKSILNRGFPTSGLAVVRFDSGLCNAEPGAGYLESFHAPGDM